MRKIGLLKVMLFMGLAAATATVAEAADVMSVCNVTDSQESDLAFYGETTAENTAFYESPKIPLIDKIVNNNKIKVDTTQNLDFLYEKVIVGKDTVSIVLPQKNYGRYDRGLYNFLFIPKGQWAFALTASYGEFSSENIQLFSLISNIDVTLKGYSIKPAVSYFFRHNQSIGLRFDYTNIYGGIDNLYFDFDDDINFNLAGVSYLNRTYSMSLFYRNYLGLGRKGRFAIFNEVALKLGGGFSDFTRNYAGVPKLTHTDIFTTSLNFSPGLCVFIQEYVSFNVSFGVFGLNFRREKQNTDGVDEGTRYTSGANFRFNIFNISFGIGVHI